MPMLFRHSLHTNFIDVVSMVNNSIGRTVTKVQRFIISLTVALLLSRISMQPCSMFPSRVMCLNTLTVFHQSHLFSHFWTSTYLLRWNTVTVLCWESSMNFHTSCNFSPPPPLQEKKKNQTSHYNNKEVLG